MQTAGPDNRRQAGLLYALTAIFWFSQYAITPYINAELQRMGQTAGFMGLVGGAYGFSQMLVRVPAGLMADRLGRQKPFIVMGCALTALAGLGFLLWYTPASFLALRLVAGLASASWVSFTVMYGSFFPPKEGPRRISQLNIANQAGRLLCYVLVAWAVASQGLRSAFQIAAAAGMLCLLLSLMLREQPRPNQGLSLRTMLSVVSDRNMRVTSLLGLLTQIIAFGTYLSFSVNLGIRLGASKPELSALSLVLTIAAVLANLTATGSRTLSKVRPKALIELGFILAALYCVMAPLCQTMGQLYLAQALAGISSGFTFAMLLGQCVKDIEPELRGAGMGLYQAIYGIGMTLGPILMGVMIDALGMNAAFFLMAGLSAVTAWITRRYL